MRPANDAPDEKSGGVVVCPGKVLEEHAHQDDRRAVPTATKNPPGKVLAALFGPAKTGCKLRPP